jgi:hypothetical protein
MTALQIREGRYYIDRSGKMYGPTIGYVPWSVNEMFYRDGQGRFWNSRGHSLPPNPPMPHDLVAECEAPAVAAPALPPIDTAFLLHMTRPAARVVFVPPQKREPTSQAFPLCLFACAVLAWVVYLAGVSQ